jgi:hypothetical protein
MMGERAREIGATLSDNRANTLHGPLKPAEGLSQTCRRIGQNLPKVFDKATRRFKIQANPLY